MKKILLLFIPLLAACNGVKDAKICEFRDGRQAAVSQTYVSGLDDAPQVAVFELVQGNTPESLASWVRNTIENAGPNVYKTLTTKNDSVWIDSSAAVSAYIQERDNCTIKASRKGDVLTITPSCSLEPSDNSEMLTAAVTLREGVRYFSFDPFGGPQTYDLSDPLLGKVINMLGDSYVRNHVRPFTETWHYKAAKKNGMIYNNYGINGSSIAFDRSAQGFGIAMMERYRQMRHDADYILVFAGHNDAYFVAREPDSTAVMLERIDTFFNRLVTDFPDAKIGYVTPWRVDKPYFPEVIARAKECCARYGIKVLDVAAEDFIIDPNDEAFRAEFFQTPWDNAHLNPKGHDLVVPAGEEFIRGL